MGWSENEKVTKKEEELNKATTKAEQCRILDEIADKEINNGYWTNDNRAKLIHRLSQFRFNLFFAFLLFLIGCFLLRSSKVHQYFHPAPHPGEAPLYPERPPDYDKNFRKKQQYQGQLRAFDADNKRYEKAKELFER